MDDVYRNCILTKLMTLTYDSKALKLKFNVSIVSDKELFHWLNFYFKLSVFVERSVGKDLNLILKIVYVSYSFGIKCVERIGHLQAK